MSGDSRANVKELAPQVTRANVSFLSMVLFAVKYIHNSSLTNRRGTVIGITAVFLVVVFVSLLANLVQHSPLIFLKLAETQVTHFCCYSLALSTFFFAQNRSGRLTRWWHRLPLDRLEMRRRRLFLKHRPHKTPSIRDTFFSTRLLWKKRFWDTPTFEVNSPPKFSPCCRLHHFFLKESHRDGFWQGKCVTQRSWGQLEMSTFSSLIWKQKRWAR